MLEHWAKPLSRLWNGAAAVLDAFYRRLGRPGKLFQDFLNGAWLGHSLHPVLVDVVVGGATAALLLQVLTWFRVADLRVAMLWVLGLTWLAGTASIVTGLTDFKDTASGDERNVVGLHGLTNIAATVVFVIAFLALLGGADAIAGWLLAIGYLVLSVGAFIGGHVVFKYGYMVNRNAFARGKAARSTPPCCRPPTCPRRPPPRQCWARPPWSLCGAVTWYSRSRRPAPTQAARSPRESWSATPSSALGTAPPSD